MSISENELKIRKEAEKRKKEEKDKARIKAEEEAKKKANQFKNEILTLLQAKENGQKQCFTCQKIEEQILAKRLGTYRGQLQELREKISNALNALKEEGKIKIDLVDGEKYYSAV